MNYVIHIILINSLTNNQTLQQFENDCLNSLHKARTMALIEPALYATSEITLMTAGTSAMIYFIGTQSLGGSFAIFAIVSNALMLMPRIIRSAYYLISRPDNVLESLEDQFAKNKCYIPKALWPKITKSFISARQNEFSREEYTNFLNNALHFTIYKPKPTIKFKNNMSLEQVKTNLNLKIDDFFSKYTNSEEVIKSLSYIKINVSKFIDSLISSKRQIAPLQAPRYLYLHGLGGIGKTYFAQTLAGWIDELIPGSVRFEELVIHSADQLEGTPNNPGAMLNVLRNQLMENKRGSIVMIDEATWLNDLSMISSSKRIFNGDLSKLSTSYFGTNTDGSNINLEIPPMLIIVASNDTIKDPALKSRFDVIDYPSPNEQALIDYGINLAQNSVILKNALYIIKPEEITSWIKNLTKENKNFRYIAGNIEAFCLAKK